MSEFQFWGRKTFCLITGASQGIGRQLTIEMGRNMCEGSVFLLLARSVPGMEETRGMIKDVNPNVRVCYHSVDLMHPNSQDFTRFIQSTLTEVGMEAKDFDLGMIVHNAGTVGDVSERASEMFDHQKWADYLSLNFISVTCLNSVFLSLFPAEVLKEVCVVNITSLCAVKPFKSMGYYCVGKAARQMYFKVLAEENPDLNVLSYSPGPVDTDMITEVIDKVADVDVRNGFVDIKRDSILTPEQTAKRFVLVLAARKYKYGERVDYYDEKY